MRDFSWRYFTLTGDIDAYLLMKTHEQVVRNAEEASVDEEESTILVDSM